MNSPGAKVDPLETLSQPDSQAIWPAIALSVLGGVLLGIAYPPNAIGQAGWVALTPFILVAFGAPDQRSAFLRLLPGFILAYAIAFPWPWRHPLAGPAIAGTLAWLWLALLPPAVLALSTRVLRTMGDVPAMLCAAAGLLAVEAFLTHSPLAMPWALMGHTQADADWAWGIVVRGGVEALSAAMVTFSTILAYAVRRRRWTAGLGGAFVVLVLFLLPVPADREASDIKVGIVQPAMGPMAWSRQDELRLTLLQAGSAPLVDADLIVWPESAVRRVEEVADPRTVAGLTLADPATNGIAGAGGLLYEKRRLVPFVEAVPGEVDIPLLGRLRLDPDGYRPGERSPVADVAGHAVGLAICFETLFGTHFRELTGTRINVAVTQDGWWHSSLPAYQHLAFTRFRALESGVPLAVASVNGYSALFGPDGRLRWISEWNEPASHIVNVPAVRPSSYVGNLIALPAAALFLTLLLLSSRPAPRFD